MVTVIYLIRHGETEGAEKKRYKGTIDVPLSGQGILQMEQLSKYMAGLFKGSTNSHPVTQKPRFAAGEEFLSAVYCSDLQRSIRSAEIIAGPHALRPVLVPALRERNFGVWEGMSFDEIKEKYPDEFDAWAGNPLQFSPVGGESTIEVRERVMNSLHEIIHRHQGEHVAVVAHGGVNRIIICHMLGIPLENIFRIEQDYSALNIFKYHANCPVAQLINGTVHRREKT